jgi:hypothetical protein
MRCYRYVWLLPLPFLLGAGTVKVDPSGSDVKISSLYKGLVADLPLTDGFKKASLVSDRTIYSNDGTLGGTPPVPASDGTDFNGTSDYVDLNSNVLGDVSATKVSISFWIYITADDFDGTARIVADCCSGNCLANDGFVVVVDDRGVGGNPTNSIWVSISTAAGAFYRNTDSGDNSIATGTAAWYHFVYTYEPSTAKIYINGSDSTGRDGNWGGGTGTGDFTPNSLDIFIGATNIDTAHLDAKIQHFKLYDRVLSPAEALEQFNDGRLGSDINVDPS